MRAALNGLLCGIFLMTLTSILGIVCVFLYGIAFAPQDIHISILSLNILAVTTYSSGGFGITMMNGLTTFFIIGVLVIAILWFLFEMVWYARNNRRKDYGNKVSS